nr:hypothetical protein [Tanacetum cinerariifolium]
MKEYIRLEEEKARRHVSSINNDEIDFRISFDESNDEDYTRKLVSKNGYGILDMALPPRDQRHQHLRTEVHKVQVFDFGGLTNLMVEGLRGRMPMKHTDAQGQSVFTSRAWRRLFKIRCPLVHELILEFFSTFRFEEAVLESDTTGALQFQLGGDMRRRECEADPRQGGFECLLDIDLVCGGFSGIAGRSQAPEKVIVTDLFYLRGMDVGSVNVPYLLPRLQIYVELNDTWAWVASGPERQQVAAAGTSKATEDAPVADEGAPAVPAPVQAPQPPHPIVGPARTMA